MSAVFESFVRRNSLLHNPEELSILANTLIIELDAKTKNLSWSELIKRSVRICAELIIHSLWGLVAVLLFWLPRRYSAFREAWRVDIEDKEHVIVPALEKNPFILIASTCSWDIPILFFFPVCFAFYINASKRQFVALMSFTLGALLAFRFALYPALGLMAAVLPVFFPVILLRVVLGKGTNVPFAAFLSAIILVLGFLFLVFLSNYSMSDDAHKFIAICIIFPVIKELSYIIARALALYMAFSPNIKVEGHMLRRDLSWIIHIWLQLFTAMVTRLFFSRFSDTTNLIAAIAFQSVCELFTRITMNKRDRWVQKLKARIFGKHKNKTVVMPAQLELDLKFRQKTATNGIKLHKVKTVTNLENAAKPMNDGEPITTQTEHFKEDKAPPLSDDDRSVGFDPKSILEHSDSAREVIGDLFHIERSDAIEEYCRRHFTASVVAGEMMSEYTAIFLSPIILTLFSTAQLQLPFDHYVQEGKFSIHPLDEAGLWRGTLLQFVAEIVVDCCCVIVEEREGLDILGAWRLRPKYFVILYIWAAWYASCHLLTIADMRDSVTNCREQDMCVCANGNGLYATGIRQLYCDYISESP